MSRREEKRLRAGRHDGRRWLKKHPPRRGDPLWGLAPRAAWALTVGQAVRAYPQEKRWRESNLRNGERRSGRRSPSAERVFFHNYGGRVTAVDAALERFKPSERAEIRRFLETGERKQELRPVLDRFYRYVAAFLGFGRKEWRL